MPGVVVTTATRGGGGSPLVTPSGQFFAVGLLERGDTAEATLLRSMADVSRYFGNRPSFGALYDQLATFFGEGGQQAYVARVVGPGATKGTLTLQDRAGSPVNTLRVDAQNAGAWSAGLKIQVRDGAGTNTFRITVTLNDAVVEDVNNISSPADAVVKFAKSPYIRVVDLGSATAAPNNNPAVLAATVLSTGSDDRASITSTHYLNALALFKPELGDGAVAIPGQTGSTIWDGIVAHCEANYRVALLAGIQNETISNLKSQAAGIDSEYAGLFAPWVQISDGGYSTRTISPEGYVAAVRARAHQQVGPWRAPAGAIAKAATLLGVSQTFTADEANDLNDAKVSVIRSVANTIRLYGWRSLAIDDVNYKYLKDRDLLNRLVVQALKELEDYVFQPIDRKGQLLSAINAQVVGMVDPIAQAGGLYALFDDDGNQIDPGYSVDTGSSVNTAVTLANDEVRVLLQVRIAPLADLITLNIVKVGLLSGF